MYESLNQHLLEKGLKSKADENLIKSETLKSEYKNKEKTKNLTIDERVSRIEKILGITDDSSIVLSK